jgi:hypothetical protein
MRFDEALLSSTTIVYAPSLIYFGIIPMESLISVVRRACVLAVDVSFQNLALSNGSVLQSDASSPMKGAHRLQHSVQAVQFGYYMVLAACAHSSLKEIAATSQSTARPSHRLLYTPFEHKGTGREKTQSLDRYTFLPHTIDQSSA